MSTAPQTIRIFISSPGDVATERDRAKDVVTLLCRWYGDRVKLLPVLWEELPLTIEMSFQDQIDVVARSVDIAVFIVWSKIGTPCVVAGKSYHSGTERELDLMLSTLKATGNRPDILFYVRKDDRSFDERLQAADDDGKLQLIEQKKLASAFVQEQFWGEEGNVRAYHSFQRPVDFAGRLKVHLGALIDQRLEGAGALSEVRWREAPYRGLEVFDLEHAAIFFGRDLEVAELEQRLRDRHRTVLDGAAGSPGQPSAFVAVVGASGSGKSSLVRAGLLSSLIDGNVDPAIQDWRTVVLIPGQTEGDLLGGLVQALAETEGALPELRDAGVPLASLAESLGRAPREALNLGFSPMFQRLSGSGKGRVQLLVVVDQFEELFTDNRIGDADREAFLHALEALAQSGWCWVVATMRSDFYPLAQRSPTFLRLKGETGQFDLLPPGPESLRKIITEPARLAGVSFEKRDASLGGQSLDAKILDDAQKQPDTLPLLSDLLLALYLDRDPAKNLLTFASYERLGGIEGALTQRAEAAFLALAPDQQAVCPELLHALVTVEADSDAFAVRRRANKVQLGDTPAKEALIDAFIAARLLTASRDAGNEATVTLAHEALLRGWDRVANWVRDNRQHLQIRSRVEQGQKRWETAGQRDDLLLADGLPLDEGLSLLHDAPQLVTGAEYAGARGFIEASREYHEKRIRRAKHRRRLAMATMSILTLLALAGGMLAFAKWKEAEVQTAEARVGEGRFYLELARRNDEPLLSKQIFAAQAIAFRNGYGRPSDAVFASLDRRSRDFSFWEEQPLLLDPATSPREWGEALNAIQGTDGQFRPILYWSSPVRRHHLGPVYCVDWSPDGTRLASGALDMTVRIWDTSTGKALLGEPLMGHADRVYSVAWSPDGTHLASASWDHTVRIWDTRKGTALGEPMLGHCGWVTSVVWSPDGTRLASSSYDGTVRIWDVSTGKALGEPLASHSGGIESVDWSPDGTRLATGSHDGKVRIWDAASGKAIGEPLGGHLEQVASVAWSPDGTRLASCYGVKQGGSQACQVQIWDTAAGKPLGKPLEGHTGDVTSVAWSPDGTRLASGSGDKTIRIWDAATGNALCPPLVGHSAKVMSVAWSPDGSRLASSSFDNTIRIWDIATGKALDSSLAGHSGDITSVAWSPDGTRLATGSWDKTVRIWDTTSGKALGGPLEGHSDRVDSVVWSPDGTRLASGSYDGTVRIWNAVTGKPLGKPLAHSGWVTSVAWSPDSTRLASCYGIIEGGESKDHTVQIWDAATGESIGAPLEGDADRVATVAWSPDGARLATGSHDGKVRIWEAATCKALGEPMAGPFGDVKSLDWSPDGTRLAIASEGERGIWDAATGKLVDNNYTGSSFVWSPDGDRLASALGKSVEIWDATDGVKLGELQTGDAVWDFDVSVAWSPDGTRLASASGDKTVWIWDVPQRALGEPLTGHFSIVASVAWNPDGSRLASGSWDKTVRIWDAATGKPLGKPLAGHSGDITSVAWSPDGTRLASGSSDQTVRVWDVATGKVLGEPLAGHSDRVDSVVWSPDGTRLASGSYDGTVRIWNAVTGKPLGKPLEGHTGDVTSVAWSPDGTRLASGSSDQTVRVWDVATGKVLGKPLEGHGLSITSVAWSPDGTRLASGSDDRTLQIWDAATGEPLGKPLEGHRQSITSVAWSPDGTRLASGSDDRTLQIWDAATGEPLGYRLEGHSERVNSVAWSPDGARLASASGSNYESGSKDSTVRIWDTGISRMEASYRPDLSVYLRKNWARIDRAQRAIDWLVPSDGLFAERCFEPVNVRPGSITARLSEAKDDAARFRVLFSDFTKRRLWKSAWVAFQQSPENREAFASELFHLFYLAASGPDSRYPANWLPDRVKDLLSDHSRLCRPILAKLAPFQWKHFATGQLAYRANTGLEPLALESLDMYEAEPLDASADPELRLTRALLLYRTGKSDLAGTLVRTILPALGPEAVTELLHLSGNQGRRDEFEFLIDLVTKLRPAELSTQTVAGWYFLGFGEPARALPLITAAQAVAGDMSAEVRAKIAAQAKDEFPWGETPEALSKQIAERTAELIAGRITAQRADVLAGLAAAQWATGDQESAKQTYRTLLGLNDERFTSDQTPEPPYAIHDHLDRPVPIPALTEVFEALKAHLETQINSSIPAGVPSPPAAAVPGQPNQEPP